MCFMNMDKKGQQFFNLKFSGTKRHEISRWLLTSQRVWRFLFHNITVSQLLIKTICCLACLNLYDTQYKICHILRVTSDCMTLMVSMIFLILSRSLRKKYISVLKPDLHVCDFATIRLWFPFFVPADVFLNVEVLLEIWRHISHKIHLCLFSRQLLQVLLLF
jgi:hypothetical protein